MQPGEVVVSRAGRDAGRPMVVLATVGDRILVADGQLRKVGSPKRKNPRHLVATGYVDALVASRVQAGKPVTNRELREALARYLAARGDGAPAPQARDAPASTGSTGKEG